MLVYDEPLSEYDHIHQKTIYFDFSLLFGHESVVLFGCIDTQKTNKESPEKDHPVVGGYLINVF
jgi:hypothetical protein